MAKTSVRGGRQTVILGLVLSLFLTSTGAFAGSVFVCRQADGTRSYQDHVCPPSQQQSRVEIAAAPPAAASPSPAHALPAARAPAQRAPRARAASRAREPASYECRADNGEVFYRHSTCPGSIRIDAAQSTVGTRRGGKTATARVTGTVIARTDACRRMRASGFSGRAGHERDDRASTYDRNLGRDPCR